MLEALRNFVVGLGVGSDPRGYSEADYRLAAAALLVHVAAADGQAAAAEQDRLKAILSERFGLDATQAAELLARAEDSDRDAVDFFQFTSVLKRELDEAGRRRVVGMMWEIACADGRIHEFEENAIWRIAELLGVSARERVELRRSVCPGAEDDVEPRSGSAAELSQKS